MPDDGPISSLFGISQRLPPSNVAAEQALLGALLSNNKVIDRCEGLEPDHFADPINARIFHEARRLIDAGRLADAVTLKTVFQNAGVLEDVGGTAYLAQLLSAMVGIINAGDYAKVVKDTWMRRQLIDLAEQTSNLAFGADPTVDAEGVASAVMDRLLTLSERGDPAAARSFSEIAEAAVRQSVAAYRGDAGHERIDTGIPSVDRLWRGMWPGQLYFVMARSNTGKTPFMLQIARHAAGTFLEASRSTGKPPAHVHIWSLEMTAEDLMHVNLASTTRWAVDQIKAGQIGEATDWTEYEAAAKSLGSLPIHVDDPPSIDLPTLQRRSRAIRRRKNTKLILVDFRELIRRGPETTRMQLPEWVPYLSYGLKELAKATGTAVVALCQINKPEKGVMPEFPTINDLPYGGEQAADGVFGLFRPELYMDGEPPNLAGLAGEKRANAISAWEERKRAVAGKGQFGVVKRRFGPKGMTWLAWNGPRMLLSDWTLRDHYGAPPMHEDRYG